MRKSILAVLISLIAAAAHAERTPVDVVGGFYAERIKSNSTGAPTGRELVAFSSYLSPELVCLLSAALRYNEQFAKTHPDDKPPFAEGDLYSSVFEGPTRFKVGAATLDGDTYSVRTRFYLDDGDSQDDKGWEDVAELTRYRNRWLIADISYQGGFEFGNHGRLTESLRSVLQHPDPTSGWDARELESCKLDRSLLAKPSQSKKTASAKSKATKGKRGGKASGRVTTKKAVVKRVGAPTKGKSAASTKKTAKAKPTKKKR